MNDEDRKLLTEYLGECWHENWHSAMMGSHCDDCLVEGKSAANRRRTFTTPADLYAVYSKMAERGEWDEYQQYGRRKHYKRQVALTVDHTAFMNRSMQFDAWLSCYGCPDQISERMAMVADWVKEDSHES